MDQLLRDVRFGARTLIKNRWFTLLAIATLGLGIGANTAIFSVIYGVLLKPLPYSSGDRLLLVREAAPLAGRPNVGVSVSELYDYRAQSRAFDALVEYHQMNFDLLNRGEPDRVSTGVVSHDFFNVLGIKPILGRTFVEPDDALGADAVLVLSYTYWQTRFGGDPHIVGRVFQMNDRPHTVIGVLPNVPHYPQENDVYMPVSACPFRANAERTLAQAGGRRNFTLTVFGRLKPDVTPDQATKDVDVICSRFVKNDPTTYRPGAGFTSSTLAVRDALTSQARPMLLILLATTGLVLIIACANVANLTLARLLRRDRELAVRTALGAGRGQLIRQLLTESVLLSLAGGAVGLLFASSTMKLLTTFVGRFTARTSEIGIDPWVLGFTLLVSIVTGVAFGTFPALSSRVDLVNTMKQGARGGTSATKRRMQNGLIVAQVSVSVLLLVGAGLLLASFVRLQRVDPGYRGDHVLSAQAFPNFSRYPNAGDHLRFYEPVLERLKAEPGVISAAVTDAVPLGAGNPFNIPFVVEGHNDNPDKRPSTDVRTVSPDYFKTLGIPLVGGRIFRDGDRRDGPRVVIVNQAMLRYFEGKDPIGARISIGNPPPNAPPTWATIVGVVGDVRQFALEQPSAAQVYQPLSQSGGLAGRFLVRTQSDPLAAAGMLRGHVHAVDPAMPVVNVRTLDDLRQRYLTTPKVTAMLLTIFAALALIVTMAGLGGVIAASVTQRTHEFGVRMALGASRERVMRVVIGQGLALVTIGLAIGFAAATAFTRVLTAYLFDTQPTDPLTLAAVAGAFVAAGILACAGPAWRATTVDPMVALRAD